jgi:hypothetical protein
MKNFGTLGLNKIRITIFRIFVEHKIERKMRNLSSISFIKQNFTSTKVDFPFYTQFRLILLINKSLIFETEPEDSLGPQPA